MICGMKKRNKPKTYYMNTQAELPQGIDPESLMGRTILKAIEDNSKIAIMSDGAVVFNNTGKTDDEIMIIMASLQYSPSMVRKLEPIEDLMTEHVDYESPSRHLLSPANQLPAGYQRKKGKHVKY